MQIPYQEKNDRSHPKQNFPDGFDIFHTSNHWDNEEMSVCLFQKITFLYVKKVREEIRAQSQKAMVLMNNFSSQTTTSLLEKVEVEGVVIVMIPPGTN